MSEQKIEELLGESNFTWAGIPADVRIHTQYYRGQALGDYRSGPLVYLYFAAPRIL